MHELLLKRILIFSFSNNCLYKVILENLKISSYFYMELKQFLSKYIEENIDKLKNQQISNFEI